MKLSEFFELVENAKESTPSEEGIHFGCDCGCGGEFYTGDDWDDVHNDSDAARKKLLTILINNNVITEIDDQRFENL